MFKVRHLSMCSQDFIIVCSVTAKQELEVQACTATPIPGNEGNHPGIKSRQHHGKSLMQMTCYYLQKENATSLNLPWLQPKAGSVQASLNLTLLLNEVVESVWHPELLNSHPRGWTEEKARFPYHSSE